jgi:hypothetical protein
MMDRLGRHPVVASKGRNRMGLGASGNLRAVAARTAAAAVAMDGACAGARDCVAPRVASAGTFYALQAKRHGSRPVDDVAVARLVARADDRAGLADSANDRLRTDLGSRTLYAASKPVRTDHRARRRLRDDDRTDVAARSAAAVACHRADGPVCRGVRPLLVQRCVRRGIGSLLIRCGIQRGVRSLPNGRICRGGPVASDVRRALLDGVSRRTVVRIGAVLREGAAIGLHRPVKRCPPASVGRRRRVGPPIRERTICLTVPIGSRLSVVAHAGLESLAVVIQPEHLRASAEAHNGHDHQQPGNLGAHDYPDSQTRNSLRRVSRRIESVQSLHYHAPRSATPARSGRR